MAGGSSGPSPDGRKKARIEIIPLIDVIFFLLATFVLFTLSLNKIQSVPVDLPKVEPNAQPPPPDDPSVTIQVSDAGTVYWNKEMMNITDVPGRLSNYVKQVAGPDQKVLVAGDDKAKYGDVIAVLDAVREVKIEKVSVETTARPTGR